MGKQNNKPSAIEQLHKSFKNLSKITEDEFIGKSAINTARIKLIIELQEQNSKVIKLNEELTTENARLLTELEGITSDKQYAENAYNNAYGQLYILKNTIKNLKIVKETYKEIYKDLDKELTSIKSKWWYKLMTWGW